MPTDTPARATRSCDRCGAATLSPDRSLCYRCDTALNFQPPLCPDCGQPKSHLRTAGLHYWICVPCHQSATPAPEYRGVPVQFCPRCHRGMMIENGTGTLITWTCPECGPILHREVSSEIGECKARAQGAFDARDKAQGALAQARLEICELKHQLAACEADRQVSSDTISALESLKRQLAHEREQDRLRRDQWGREARTLNEEIVRLRGECDHLSACLAEMPEELVAAESQRDRWIDAHHTVVSDLKAACAERDALQTEIKELSQKVVNLASDLEEDQAKRLDHEADHEEETAALKAERDKLQAEIDALGDRREAERRQYIADAQANAEWCQGVTAERDALAVAAERQRLALVRIGQYRYCDPYVRRIVADALLITVEELEALP